MARTKEQDAARKREERARRKAEGKPVKSGGNKDKAKRAEYQKAYREKRKAEGNPIKRTKKNEIKDPRKLPWNLSKYTRKDKETPKFLTWDIETVASEKVKDRLLETTNKRAKKTAKKGELPTLLEWANEEKTLLRVAGTNEEPFKPGWDLAGDTVIVSVCIDGEPELHDTDDLTGLFLEKILIPEFSGYYIYAHNAFGFDLKRLDFGRIMNKGFSAETICGNSNDMKSITLRKGEDTWIFRDSLLLLNNKLDKLGKAFANMQKQDLDFETETFDVKNEKHREYALADSIVLYQIIEKADELFMANMGVSIHDKATLPGLAFQAMKQLFTEEEYFEGVSFECAHACRESYHGGQTIAFNTKKHINEKSFDANSMYVYIMKEYPLPTGKPMRYYYLPDDANPERTLCLAKVNIPEGVFPFLKTKDAKGKVGNYRGTVVGWYWLFELEFQKEIGGSYDVFECYEWEKDTDAIQRFARKCEALRMQDYNGAVGMIGKLFGNSGYGKFAQVTPDTQLVLSTERPDNSLVHFHPGKDMNDDAFAWVVETEKRLPSPDMVHWASYITAHSRLHLSKIMQAVGFENVDYCDTDSIFIEARHAEKIPAEMLGGVYGQFKLEKDMETFQAFGKKAYEFKDAEKGSRTIANKGIPRSALKDQVIKPGKEQAGQTLYFLSTPSLAATWLNHAEATIGHRSLVTPESLTDGKFINGVWTPDECEPMSYIDLIVPLKDRSNPEKHPNTRKIDKFNKWFNRKPRKAELDDDLAAIYRNRIS